MSTTATAIVQHHLTRDDSPTLRYVFQPLDGATVRIRFYDGSWCRTERSRSLEQAREEYRLLVRAGWRRW